MKKFLENTMVVLSVVFLLWLGISWADIVADNCEPHPTHAPWNAFVLMTEAMENAQVENNRWTGA